METVKSLYGHTHDGEEVYIFTLRNKNGIKAEITNYGGIVTSLLVPSGTGKLEDTVLGFERLEDYLGDHPYVGAVLGRYANRIADARFELDGEIYRLAANNGSNHLHGGTRGFDKMIWDYKIQDNGEGPSLILTRISPHGEEGYPGNLSVEVGYTLTNDNGLKIRYKATTDRATHINLSHHGYFNLTGGKKSVLGHELMINASRFTEVDDEAVPTGKITDVSGTALDFRKMKSVGKDIFSVKGGYDHNYVLDDDSSHLKKAALLFEPDSGRCMEVLTTKPGIQFYTGNFLDGTLTGKGGIVYHKHQGLCLETQYFPDSPNQPSFPETILKPGKEYIHTTIYRFSEISGHSDTAV